MCLVFLWWISCLSLSFLSNLYSLCKATLYFVRSDIIYIYDVYHNNENDSNNDNDDGYHAYNHNHNRYIVLDFFSSNHNGEVTSRKQKASVNSSYPLCVGHKSARLIRFYGILWFVFLYWYRYSLVGFFFRVMSWKGDIGRKFYCVIPYYPHCFNRHAHENLGEHWNTRTQTIGDQFRTTLRAP